jgi:hypothetical protein
MAKEALPNVSSAPPIVTKFATAKEETVTPNTIVKREE